MDSFTDPKYVKEFLHFWKEGFLPRGEVFSIFYEHQKEEAVALFNVFYYAKDWETFYKVACWAREYVNEGKKIQKSLYFITDRHLFTTNSSNFSSRYVRVHPQHRCSPP